MRWFTVIATRSVCTSTMQFESRTDINVLAMNANDAMRKVRPEFKGFHLQVVA